MKSHYETLGIQESAGQDEIKKAYFELAKKYHPDSGDVSEIKKFHELSEAYQTLSDKELRQVYDETLKVGMEHINKIEEELVQRSPADPQINRQPREDYRNEELDAFYKSRFRRAILKVIVFSVLISALGAFLGWFLDDSPALSGVAGLLIGFGFSMQKHFDLESFFSDVNQHRRFCFILWFLMTLGILYFLALFFYDLIL